MSSEQDHDFPPLPPIYRLSQELIDEIIDIIHLFAEEKWWEYRWDYLSSCALVCRSFFPRAQTHLFTHVNLPGLPESRWVKEEVYSRIPALLGIIENRPSITQHIQDVGLHLPGGNTSWLYREPEMLQLMEKINSTQSPIRSLLLSAGPALSSLKTSAYGHGFPHLHRFFKKAIAPYITTLRLEFVFRVPVELVTMCTQLQHLTLLYTTFAFTEPDILGFLDLDTREPLNRPVERDRRPRILSLEYKLLEYEFEIQPDTTLARLLTDRSLLDFSHLRSLTTYTDDPIRNLDLVQMVVDASKGRLLDVIVDIYNPELKLNYLPSTNLNFANQPNLQNLAFIAFFQSPNSDVEGPGGGISDTCKMLQTIVSSSNDATARNSSSTSGRLRVFNLTLIVYQQSEEVLLGDPNWETFVSEVLRIASSSGQEKVALSLEMQYHAAALSESEAVGAVSTAVSATAPAEGEDVEVDAEAILKRLVDERLAPLRDCAWVALDRCAIAISGLCVAGDGVQNWYVPSFFSFFLWRRVIL